MRVLAAVLVLAVLAVAAVPVQAWADSSGELVYGSGWDRAVVIAVWHQQYGTAFFVSGRWLVTAGHVVGYYRGAEVDLVRGGWEGKAVVAYVDREGDVAVLRLTSEPPGWATSLPVQVSPPEKLDQIIAIGYPYELVQVSGGDLRRASEKPRTAWGRVNWRSGWVAEIGTTVDAGNSGGPVINPKGAVVGIVTFALSGRAATLYFITTGDRVAEALSAAGAPYTPYYRVSGEAGFRLADTRIILLAAGLLAAGLASLLLLRRG